MWPLRFRTLCQILKYRFLNIYAHHLVKKANMVKKKKIQVFLLFFLVRDMIFTMYKNIKKKSSLAHFLFSCRIMYLFVCIILIKKTGGDNNTLPLIFSLSPLLSPLLSPPLPPSLSPRQLHHPVRSYRQVLSRWYEVVTGWCWGSCGGR